MSNPALVPDTRQPEFEVEIEREVPVPMRDGTVLRADVYRPAADGRFPVLVERCQDGEMLAAHDAGVLRVVGLVAPANVDNLGVRRNGRGTRTKCHRRKGGGQDCASAANRHHG